METVKEAEAAGWKRGRLFRVKGRKEILVLEYVTIFFVINATVALPKGHPLIKYHNNHKNMNFLIAACHSPNTGKYIYLVLKDCEFVEFTEEEVGKINNMLETWK